MLVPTREEALGVFNRRVRYLSQSVYGHMFRK